MEFIIYNQSRQMRGRVPVYAVWSATSARASRKYGMSSRRQFAETEIVSRADPDDKTPPNNSVSLVIRNAVRLLVFYDTVSLSSN